MSLLRLPLSLLSPAGALGRLNILIFHRVLSAPDALCPDAIDAVRFEAQLRWLRSWFEVLPLADAVQRLIEGRIPARALAITFDDGYADNEEIAAPILSRLGMTATFFVATGFLAGDIMWNDRVIEALRGSPLNTLDLQPHGLARYDLSTLAARRHSVAALLNQIKHLDPQRRRELTDAVVAGSRAPQPAALMMRPEQVRSLRRMGMTIGAHTVSHPILTRLSLDDARAEIAGSKQALEQLLDEPVPLFAYPNGMPGRDYAPEHAALVRECGFAGAVSTAWGAASMASDRYQLPRFTPWDHSRWRYGARLIRNLRRIEATA